MIEGYSKPIPDHDMIEHLTVKEFHIGVLNGVYTKDDGVGYYAVADAMSDLEVSLPNFSQKELKAIPESATHVVWFNK